MPDNITSIITGAIADATDGSAGDALDTGDTLDTGTDDAGVLPDDTGGADDAAGGDPDAGEGSAESDLQSDGEGTADPDPADDAAVADPDAALLAELGFSKEVGRDNRMPVSRAKKFVLNGVKKFIAKHEGDLKAARAEAEPFKVKAAQLDNADRMILTNPEGFMTFLAGVNPAYKDYVKGGAASTAAPTVPESIAALGPAPAPDLKYADGTEGFSPKQWAAHTEWTEKRAVAMARESLTKDLDARIKPFETQRATAEKIARDAAERQTNVRDQIREAEEAWGDALPKQGSPDHAAVLKLIRENPSMRLTTAVGKILVPKLRTGRAALRKEVLAELEAAPAGATRRVGQQGRTTDAGDGGGPKTTEQIIKESIAGLRR